MTHFVCSPFGSSGDVHPMMGLAVALHERGHRVTVITHGYFEPLVRRFGLEYQELGTEEAFLEAARNPLIWHPTKAFPFIYRAGVEPYMREHYRLLAEHHRQGPTVAITNVFGFGAFVARERLGLKVISLHLQPSVIWSDLAPPDFPGSFGPNWVKRITYAFGEWLVIDRTVCPTLNAWRAELGLPPVRNVSRWWHSPDCVACLFPPWFTPPQSDWPANLEQTDFPLWDESDPTGLTASDASAGNGLPARVEEFMQAGEPPIVFTPGSANVFGASMFAAAVQACQQLGRRGILLTRFPEQVPDQLPDSVIHLDYVPFSHLLPRSAALVHHGGIGSMSQAMAAGVPQIILPMAHDQFDNGRRVRDLGIGRTLRHRNLRGDRLAAALGTILSDPQCRINCQRVAERFVTRDGIPRMAEALERRFAPCKTEVTRLS